MSPEKNTLQKGKFWALGDVKKRKDGNTKK